MSPTRRALVVGAVLIALVGCTASDDAADTSAPAGSDDAGSIPVDSIPVDSIPVDSIPVDSIPVDSILDGRVVPEGDEPLVLGPLGETEAEFETEDGGVQIGAAEVPEAVAASFPVPDDLDVQIASQAGEAAGFSGVTDLGFDELAAFYDTELPAAGYESTQSQFVDGVIAVYDFEGPDGSGQVAISSAPGGGHSVLVTFSS